MTTVVVNIKHAGKVVNDLPLDTSAPPAAFKQVVYEKTGIPVDRMKIMVKGGILKDDSDWKKIAPKEGQTFMVIGTAGELPKAPEKPIVFLEDMGESEVAAYRIPCGLVNLGNTCYMNACLQVMRSIPELNTSLTSLGSQPIESQEGNAALTRALCDTWFFMKLQLTGSTYTPAIFVQALRQAVPQFGELARFGKSGAGGYAQQDAEECWSQIMNALKALPNNFVDRYMMGEMRRELTCDEATEEEPSITAEKVLKIECNININTNYMHTGIMDALDQKIEKTSPSLGRQAVYSSRSRLSRIPVNLTVHMVRFSWKKDIHKKAKIMRKVKFPLEFDILDLCTDELKEKLRPVNRRLKEIQKDRHERAKVRKRTKTAISSSSSDPIVDVEMADPNVAAAANNGPSSPVMLQAPTPAGAEPLDADAAAAIATANAKGKGRAEGEALEAEEVYLKREAEELEALVPEDIKADEGSSWTGLYELVGIVTHKGAAADSGHYIGYVKRRAIKHGTETNLQVPDDDEEWYKFDDDKVTLFPKDKLSTLDGGGEDASAYVLLYRSVGVKGY